MNQDDVCFRLLGRVRIRRAGDDHFLGAGRRAALFAVLALGGGASREQLVGAVWGADPPASANGNVYTLVNGLREILGDEMLTREDGIYRLWVTGQTVDVGRFEALREQAGQYREAGDLRAEEASLQEGLDLWDGEALAGVPGPFAEAQRARLQELRLASERRRAEILLELGWADAAVAVLRPLAAAHPLQESLHRLLMLALDAAGRQDEALRVYADLSAFLVRETGTEPTAELRRARGHVAEHRTRDVLRAVAFLGDGATIDEVCQVTGLAHATVDHEIARAGEVLTVASGRVVTFRDPAVARSVYGRTPEALRSTLHGLFAELMADSFGPPERVAAQLLRADPAPLTPAASRWLLDHVDQLALRSPAAAIALLQRAHLQHLPDHDVHVALSVWLARLLFGQRRDAASEAGWVAARSEDPDVQAEMLWIAACSHAGQGRPVAAADIARSTLSARRHAQRWLDRFRNLILRLRLRLPGDPTEPRHDRTAVISENKMATYRRSIASDEPC